MVSHAFINRRMDLFVRQMQGGKGETMGFGKSKAKMMNELKGKVTFNDVAGVEAKKGRRNC